MKSRGLCAAHYWKWRVYGDPDFKKRDCPLGVEEVDRNLAAVRLRRVGPYVRSAEPLECECLRCGRTVRPRLAAIRAGQSGCGPCSRRAWGERRRGAGHPLFKGDDIGYVTAHERLRAVRGNATEWSCVDCGEPAAEWSYVGCAPDERTERIGKHGYPYSLDPDFYEPRCVSDHRRYDRAVRRERVSA